MKVWFDQCTTRKMSKVITSDSLIPGRPEGSLHIYAYSIQNSDQHSNLLKIGQTTQKVADRVKQQVQTAGITKYTIEIDVVAERDNGSFFSDHDVRNRLKSKGFKNPKGEWIECSTEDVLIISEIKSGIESLGNHYLDFKMRPEQRIAVEKDG